VALAKEIEVRKAVFRERDGDRPEQRCELVFVVQA